MKYFLKQYTDDYIRIYALNTKDNYFLRKEKTNRSSEEEIFEKSISRTKRNLRELALCNNWEYFATWTVNSLNCDRFSLSNCQQLMHKVLKAYKRINKDFKFLFITERHKNGAFHFHGFVKGLGDDIYTNYNGFLSVKFFDEKIGFFSLSKIRDYEKCCNYICKYITKDCVKNEHNQIYFCSRGLKKGVSEELVRFDLQAFKNCFNDFNYNTTYARISDFHISGLNHEQLMFLLNLNYKAEKSIDF